MSDSSALEEAILVEGRSHGGAARRTTRFIFGLFLLACVVTIWVASSQLIQFIFRGDDGGFDKPFFLTYFSTALFSVYLLGFAISRRWRLGLRLVARRVRSGVGLLTALRMGRRHTGRPLTPRTASRPLGGGDDDLSSSQRAANDDGAVPSGARDAASSTEGRPRVKNWRDRVGTERAEKPVPDIGRTFILAATFCPIWFCANYTFNVSLSMTSVASNTVLSTTSGLFTFVLGLVFLKDEKFNWYRLLAVALSFSGVALITAGDAHDAGRAGGHPHSGGGSPFFPFPPHNASEVAWGYGGGAAHRVPLRMGYAVSIFARGDSTGPLGENAAGDVFRAPVHFRGASDDDGVGEKGRRAGLRGSVRSGGGDGGDGSGSGGGGGGGGGSGEKKGGDDGRPPHPILGDILALVSALSYASYTVLLKIRMSPSRNSNEAEGEDEDEDEGGAGGERRVRYRSDDPDDSVTLIQGPGDVANYSTALDGSPSILAVDRADGEEGTPGYGRGVYQDTSESERGVGGDVDGGAIDAPPYVPRDSGDGGDDEEEDETVPMPMFFGFVGLINLCTLWPLGILLHVTGAEKFASPDGRTLFFLTINALIGTVLSDLMWARSIVLTTPLIATVGLSLTIPVALVSDAVLHGARYTGIYFAGSSLVAAGFVTAAVANKLPGAERDHFCRRPKAALDAEFHDLA